jgi:hypothetical protein
MTGLKRVSWSSSRIRTRDAASRAPAGFQPAARGQQGRGSVTGIYVAAAVLLAAVAFVWVIAMRR